MGVEDDEEEEAAPAESEADSSSTPSTRGTETSGRRAAFSEPVVAHGSASPRATMTARKTRARFANEDEAFMAEQFNLTPSDVEKYSNPRYSEDVLGFKDPKTGQMRKAV